MKHMNKNSTMSDMVDGLYVKDGRLINGRPNSINGIQQMANIKKAMDRDRMVSEIADGILRAEMRKDMFG